MEYTKKQKDLLFCLLSGNKGFSDLKKTLNFNDMTLTRQLRSLETKNLISHIYAEKKYKITSKGLSLLNTLDTETKGRIFIARAIQTLDQLFNHEYIFDTQLSEQNFRKLFDMYADIETTYTKERYFNFINEYINICGNENIEPFPSDIVLRNEFFICISKFISDVTMYISIKAIEEKDPSILTFISGLPIFLAKRIELSGLSLEQFKNHFVALSLWDDYYNQAKNITPENYKEIVSIYKNAPVDMLTSIGEDFSEAGVKYREKIKKEFEKRK